MHPAEEDIATCLKCNRFHGNLDVVSDHQGSCNDFTPAYMKAIDDLSQRFFKEFDFDNMSANSKFEVQIFWLSEARKKTTSKDFLKTMFGVYNLLGSSSPETSAKEDPEVVPSQMEREPRDEEIIPVSMGKKKKLKRKKGKKREVTVEIVEESLEEESVASQNKVIDEKVIVSMNGKQKIKMVEMGKPPHLPLKRCIYMCLDGGEPSDDEQNIQQMVDGGEPRGVTVSGEGNVQYLTEEGNVCGFEDLNLAKFDLTADGTRCPFEDLELLKFDEVAVPWSYAAAVVDTWRDTGDLLNFDSYKRTGEEFEPQFDPAILLVSQVPPSVGEEEGEIILWEGTKF